MACCMFAAFIVGHLVLMWRTIEARWFPGRAAARAAVATASAWRPGMEMPVARTSNRPRLVARMAGVALIAVSLGYFTVQARDALERADDAQSFAVLLAQNICRVVPDDTAKPIVQVAAANRK